MAQVTMDIAELDKLRASISEKETQINELNTTLTEVKSDKRVVVKTIITPANKHNASFSIDTYRILSFVRAYNNSRYGSVSESQLNSEIARCIEVHPIQEKTETTEYKNFEEVKAELAAKIEKDYIIELAQLRQDKISSEKRIAEINIAHQEKLDNLRNEHRRSIKEHEDVIDAWVKKYNELYEGKKELSKIEQLEKLLVEADEKIDKLNKRKWYHLLLNK